MCTNIHYFCRFLSNINICQLVSFFYEFGYLYNYYFLIHPRRFQFLIKLISSIIKKRASTSSNKKRKAHVKGRLPLFFLSFFLLLTWLALRRRTIPGRSYFPRVIGLDTTPTFSFLPARFPIISSVGCRSLPRPEDRFRQGDPSFVTGRPGKVSRGKRKSPCLSFSLSPHGHVNRQSFFFSLSDSMSLFFS